MKVIKTLVAIALSAGGLGTAVTLGAVANKENINNIQMAEASSSVVDGNKRINVIMPSGSNQWIFDASAKINCGGVSASVGAFDFTVDNDLGTAGSHTSAGVRQMDYEIDGENKYFATKSLGTSFTTDWWNITIRRHGGNEFWNSQECQNGKVWIDNANTYYYDGNSISAWGYYSKFALHTGINHETISYKLLNSGATPDDPEEIDGYLFVGWYTDSNCTNKWNSGNQKTDINLYARYVNKTPGYYLVGDSAFMSEMNTSGTAWDFSSGVRMNDVTSGGNKASYTITTSTTITFKARYLNTKTDYFVSHTEKSDTATEHGVTFDKDGNYVVPAGTYTLYVFVKNNEDTSSLTYGMPLDSYCTEFLDETGAICNGSSTNESALATVWATLKADWAKLHVNDQNSLVDADANESGTDVQKVMARYDVIIKNHASFEDFMNRKANSHYTYKANVTTPIPSNNNNSVLIIVIASSIILLATGMFFLLRKKRKEQ